MKNLAFLIITILSCWNTPSLIAQENIVKSQAKMSEQVWVITVIVKNEHKQAFEQWINEVMYTALRNSKDNTRQDQLKSTRWLKPAAQNADQTWTYAWIMDPVVPGADYDIPTLLRQAYGDEMAGKHWAAYESFMAKEPELISLIQTNY